jgi:hypothetical protein
VGSVGARVGSGKHNRSPFQAALSRARTPVARRLDCQRITMPWHGVSEGVTPSHEWMMRFRASSTGRRSARAAFDPQLAEGSVVEDGLRQSATKGTPQGAVISPLLANIYLHYVYDL